MSASPEFKQFKKLLKTNRYFVTMPRMRLFAIFQKHTSLSIRQIVKLLKKHDQATAYRNIELFERLGIINRMHLGQNTRLEMSDVFQHHHHHLSCTNCGKVFVLKDHKSIEREIQRIGKGTMFKITDHQLEIRGLCKECQKININN